MKTWLAPVALVILSLSACAPATGPAVGDPPPTVSIPGSESGCVAAGGEWSREGRLGAWMCVMPYADAGRPCTDGDQCLGDCRARELGPAEARPVTGVCQANTSPFGCFTRVEDGRAAATLCVD